MIAKPTDLRLYRFDYSTLASPYIYKRAQNLDDFVKAAFVNKKMFLAIQWFTAPAFQ